MIYKTQCIPLIYTQKVSKPFGTTASAKNNRKDEEKKLYNLMINFVFSIFIMLVGKKNHQLFFLNDVPEIALILPFLFLPVSIEVEVSIRLSFYDDMDHKVYCVGKQEAPKTLLMKTEG